jgi:hypothetical protein
LLEIVDISDTTMAATGTNKKIVLSDLLASVLPLAGGTMTGTITSTFGTITASTPFLDLTQTWNAGGVPFTGIKANITNSGSSGGNINSGSDSRLLDLQVGGASKFKVWQDGGGAWHAALYGGGKFYGGGFSDDYNGGGANFSQSSDNFNLAGSTYLHWSSGLAGSATQVGLKYVSAGLLEVNTGYGNSGTYGEMVAKSFRFAAPTSANGQYLAAKSLTELTTIAASATSTTTIQKPANSIILGVSVRVTTAVTCTSTFTVGDSGSATRFSTAAVSKTLNSTDPGTKAGAFYNATAEGIVITPDTVPSDATGRVRVTIHYLEMTPPTS